MGLAVSFNSETVADMEKYICEHCVFYTKTVGNDLRFMKFLVLIDFLDFFDFFFKV